MAQRPVALVGGALVLVVAVIGVVIALSRSTSPSGGSGQSSGSIGSTTPPAITSEPNPASPGPSSPYTFDDEFSGTSLSTVWGQHMTCCGQVVGVDPTLASVANGVLSLSLQQRSDGWYGALIDTTDSWRQAYGTFSARIKVPEGAGLWPAFWSYAEGSAAELDTMEVCGNPVGANGGDDASLLHTTVHWEGGFQGHDTRTVDLSQAFHVYTVDWRPTSMAFSLDGQVVWAFTDRSHIPSSPLPLILDLGLGGPWCGPPGPTTGASPTMQVDWVRASP